MYRDACRVDDAGPKVVQFLDRVRDQNANPTSPLNRYIEGWAQTDLEKILDATAPSYRFTDPFVGSFDGQSLHKYFDLLQGSTLKIRSNMSKQPFVITPKNCLRPLKILGEHAAVLSSGEAP
jgi:hypothetical protein